MCTDDNPGHAHDHDAEVSAAMPRPIEGEAVDPIALDPVDEVVVDSQAPYPRRVRDGLPPPCGVRRGARATAPDP
jgi:hypothetical protein